MAVGILSIGMLFIAGTFPTGLYLSTVAAERSIAVVAADEAFAKIRLYGVNTDDPDLVINACVDFRNVSSVSLMPDDPEFAYPSTPAGIAQGKYYWRALCRKIDAFDVQVTVFICRRSGTGLWKSPENVTVTLGINNNELLNPSEQAAINDGYTIIDSQTGQIYRVLERYWRGADNVIDLDRPWGGALSGSVWVWVVPPPVGGGRNPCIGVFQKVIRF